MTIAEIEVCRKGLHWTKGRLAREAQLSHLMVKKILAGCYPYPAEFHREQMCKALTPYVVDLQAA